MKLRSNLVPAAFACTLLSASMVFAGSRVSDAQPAIQVQAESVAMPGAVVAAVDSVVLARFDFDDAQGNPDVQGWTMYDRTIERNGGPYWHVDDLGGLDGYAPLAGARSLWCGSREPPAGIAGGTWPGYGNNWLQYFESATFVVSGDVHVSFTASYDVEQDYDYVYLEYSVFEGVWSGLATLNGLGAGVVFATLPENEHAGTIKLRLRFDSDPYYSDEDGWYDSHGAIVIDNLSVQDTTGVVDHQDFETEAVGALATADGDWTAWAASPFGLYAGLVSGVDVLQEDPAITNPTNLWGFFNGSPDGYVCGGHPEQDVVPLNRDVFGWNHPGDYFSNEVRSPWIPLDRDENGGFLAEIPDSLSLQYQIYRDLPLENLVGYHYRYRFRTDGAESDWSNLIPFVSPLKDWRTLTQLIAVSAGADEIQIALGASDVDWYHAGTGTCHTHGPLYDNVRLSAAGTADHSPLDIGAALANAGYGDVDWGDYDGDGDLDVLVVGAMLSGKAAGVYRNDGGVFTDIGAPLTGISHGSAEWGDYDSDGDLDILLAGDSGNEADRAVTRLYRNEAGVFGNVPIGISGLMGDFGDRALAWGDCDNDGDLDILIQGRGYPGLPEQYRCAVYRNDGATTFTEMATGLPPMSSGAAAWGDYDVDGDLDFALAGQLATGSSTAGIYRNQGAGQFVDIAAGLPTIRDGSLAWGDYDNDGDLDLAMTGNSPSRTSRIYRNDAGTFVDSQASLMNLGGGSVDWGDYDGDGDLDLLLTGFNSTTRYALVYINDNGVFTDAGAGLAGAIYGSAGWGDYDNDGRLDILLAGYNTTNGYFTRIYRNRAATPNSRPSAPTGLTADVAGGAVLLNWSAATDDDTPSAGLTYNVRIGTTPGGGEICSGMSDAASGVRRVARIGNAGPGTSYSLTLPPSWDHLYFSVQAIDASFAGSPFSAVLAVDQAVVAAPAAPAVYALHGNVPNPFNPRTMLSFDLPQDGRVRLEVFDVQGRCVRVLLDGSRAAGRHEFEWDGTGDDGRALASGVYLCRMAAGAFRGTMRMALIR